MSYESIFEREEMRRGIVDDREGWGDEVNEELRETERNRTPERLSEQRGRDSEKESARLKDRVRETRREEDIVRENRREGDTKRERKRERERERE